MTDKKIPKSGIDNSIGAKLMAENVALQTANQVDITEVIEIATSVARSTDIPVSPRTIFVDRAAGSVSYEQIFTDHMNLDLMIRAFREDKDLPSRLNAFYRNLKVEAALVSLMGNGLIRGSDVQFSVLQLREALQTEAKVSALDSLLLCDQLVPCLRKAGFRVEVPERFFTMSEAPRRFVTMSDLRNDAAAQHCATVIDKAAITTIGENRYAPKVLANMVAVDLRSIGARLLMVPSFMRVFDDVIIAVRASVDVANDHYSSVPEWLREHPVVHELATNMTFLAAAFAPDLPERPELQVGERDLEAQLDILAATMKASSRYSSVSLKVLASELTLSHGTDFNDEIAFAMVSTNVGYAEGIMTAMPSTSGNDVQYLDKAVSQVGEILSSHNNNVFDMRATDIAVADALGKRAGDPDLWPEGTAPLVSTLTVFDEYLDPCVLIALTQAERVTMRADAEGDFAGQYMHKITFGGRDTFQPRFVFSMRASGHRLPSVLRNQMLDQNYVVTEDARLAVLVAKSAQATSIRPATVQLPPASIYGARLLNVPASIIQKVNEGLQYSLAVGSAVVKGEFFIKSLDAVRSISAQAIIVNSANARIASAMMSQLVFAAQETSDIRKQLNLNGALYNAVIDMAGRLSKQFREEIHNKIVNAATRSVSVEQSMAMRSAYNRSLFAIQVDLFALQVYMTIIGASDAAALLQAIVADDGMQAVMTLRGSDRRKEDFEQKS